MFKSFIPCRGGSRKSERRRVLGNILKIYHVDWPFFTHFLNKYIVNIFKLDSNFRRSSYQLSKIITLSAPLHTVKEVQTDFVFLPAARHL